MLGDVVDAVVVIVVTVTQGKGKKKREKRKEETDWPLVDTLGYSTHCNSLIEDNLSLVAIGASCNCLL